ncbi:MAG: hypothetical protein CVV02_06135 [Firmicutes bacterium HGW-Firmicutes-7]|nr:MAG: hypothetical protein CVV02_06135 [Firmicutes bacterium HGW-Firmicutes-7]
MKRKISYLIMIVLLAGILSVNILARNTSAYDVDFSYSSNGIVKVLLNTESNVKSKLVIQSGDETYIYNIANCIDYVNYPLQLGNGKYTVNIYENTTGTKYKNVYSASGNVTIDSINSVFLASTQQVKWDATNLAVKLSQKLLADAKKDKIAVTQNSQYELSEKEIIDTLYTYIVKNIDYDHEKIDRLTFDYIPDIDVILQDKKGICFDYSVLLASMLRSQGIPTKLIKGQSTTTDVYHAWNEIYLSSENRWIIVDTTYDAYMNKNQKQYAMEKSSTQYTAELMF